MGAIAFDISIHRYYGDLKENGSIENGTINRCGFIGVDEALFEEVYHFGVGFEVSYAHFLLPED